MATWYLFFFCSLFFSSACHIVCGGAGDSSFILFFLCSFFLPSFFLFLFRFVFFVLVFSSFVFFSFLYFIECVCSACRIQYDDMALHCPLLCLLYTWQRSISVAQLCDHRTLISSSIEESARTLVVLDVDGEKKRFNVKSTHLVYDTAATLPPHYTQGTGYHYSYRHTNGPQTAGARVLKKEASSLVSRLWCPGSSVSFFSVFFFCPGSSVSSISQLEKVQDFRVGSTTIFEL